MNKLTTEVDSAVTNEVEDDPEDEVSTVLLVPMSGYKAEDPEAEACPEVEACPVELEKLVEAVELNQLHHRHLPVLLLEVTGGSRTGFARF